MKTKISYKLLILFIFALTQISCSNADIRDMKSIGKPANVSLYSGGVLIRHWVSTGKIQTMSDSDGWFFEDNETHKLIKVTGTVVIEN